MRRLIPLAALAVSLGCADHSITEHGPTAGHARLSGHLARATGGPAAGVALSVSCGPTAPTGFGHDLATTDAAGAYAADLDTPEGYPLPADGRLVCRVAIPAGGPVTASATATVTFATSAGARATTVVDLVEGSTTP